VGRLVGRLVAHASACSGELQFAVRL